MQTQALLMGDDPQRRQLNNHKQPNYSEGNKANLPPSGGKINVEMDHLRARYPYCIVWTPIPILTWLFPFIGHMGIAMSSGIIRDFAGPYYVSEDEMGFGKPTKYLFMDPYKAHNGPMGWDRAIIEASEEYKNRMHNLIFDNCHCHVAMAMNLMQYNDSNWNMVKLGFIMFIHGKYVNKWAFFKTWLPFVTIILSIALILLCVYYFKIL